MSTQLRSAADFKTALVDPAENYDPPIVGFEPDDEVSLQALLAEQRARAEIIRRYGLWDWLYDLPLFFVKRGGIELGANLKLAGMGLLIASALTAGFTQGPLLWLLSAACLICVILGRWLGSKPIKESLAYYQRSVFAPAAIVTHGVEVGADSRPQYWIHVLVRPSVSNWRELRALIAAAQRLEAVLAGREPVPPQLREVVEQVRAAPGLKLNEAPRFPLPPLRGFEGLELAGVISHPNAFPNGRMDSRLAFVLLDETDRAPRRTLLLRSPLWGTRIEELCAHFPLESTP